MRFLFFIIIFSILFAGLWGQEENFTSNTNENNPLLINEEYVDYNYEEELEEYQNLKLVKYVDFMFYLGTQFSFFSEPNSHDTIKNESDRFKQIYNASSPDYYKTTLNNNSLPNGINFGFDIFYHNFGFGFFYSLNNFFQSETAIRQNDTNDNYEDHYLKHIYEMSGHSFAFSFLYRFPLLKQTPENNIYIVLGAGYNFNLGLIDLIRESSTANSNGDYFKNKQVESFTSQAHGGHFLLEVLVKLENFIIASGIHWKILKFEDISKDDNGSDSVLIFNSPADEFNLNLTPYLYLKVGFTF